MIQIGLTGRGADTPFWSQDDKDDWLLPRDSEAEAGLLVAFEVFSIHSSDK